MKKILKLLLVMAITTALLIPSFSNSAFALSSKDFYDVPKDHWGVLDIDFAAAHGIVNGYLMMDGRYVFLPENSVSKEESIVMIYRALAASNQLLSTDDFSAEFTETLSTNRISDWAKKQVSYFLKFGILSQEDLVSFVGGDLLGLKATRQEAAAWVAKAVNQGLMPAYTLPYYDLNSISTEYLPYIDLLYRIGIMKGNDQGKFLPLDGIKRVEFAAISNRIFKLSTTDTGSATSSNILNLDNQSQNISGTVISADAPKQISTKNYSPGHIYMSLSNGTSKIIEVGPNTSVISNGKLLAGGVTGIQTGQSLIISYGAFSKEADLLANPWKLQILIQADKLLFSGKVTELTKIPGGLTQIAIKGDDSQAMYFMDKNTNMINTPKVGSTVTFLCDGVQILEIK